MSLNECPWGLLLPEDKLESAKLPSIHYHCNPSQCIKKFKPFSLLPQTKASNFCLLPGTFSKADWKQKVFVLLEFKQLLCQRGAQKLRFTLSGFRLLSEELKSQLLRVKQFHITKIFSLTPTEHLSQLFQEVYLCSHSLPWRSTSR